VRHNRQFPRFARSRYYSAKRSSVRKATGCQWSEIGKAMRGQDNRVDCSQAQKIMPIPFEGRISVAAKQEHVFVGG
jgi:hypothetical protein